ncbi:MAG: galactose mutarotase [Bryobacteraceae bacterium]|nr:galactose mutarotase [Bryobacteraceae bacterium]
MIGPMKAAALFALMLLAACTTAPRNHMTKTSHGQTPDGQTVDLYTITNSAGASVSISTYGATVVSLKVKDRAGNFGDVVLGFDNLAGYLGEHPYFGATIGRYGNRIAKGKFSLNGKEYTLAINNGPNALHGGLKGFSRQVWQAKEIGDDALELTYLSADGEEGYPGKLTATVRYTLTAANELRIDYTATTDADTVINLTNHSYFNLGGLDNNLTHQLEIHADRFTPVDAGLIPTGELLPVKGTPFDFTTPHAVGERIDAADEQIKRGGGYDHNFVFTKHDGQLNLVARVSEPKSGRVMEVLTTEPGVQFYTGNFLDGKLTGKGGRMIGRRAALCLETQHFPDSPNQPQFPSTVLKAGETRKSTTVYRFGVK